MNQSTVTESRPGASLLPDSIGAITSAHFVLIAVLALLVILGILWGARLKSRRKAAEREVIAHNAEITTAPAVVAERAPPAPVTPSVAPPPAPRVVPPPAPLAPTAAPTAAPSGPASGSASDGAAELTQLKGLGPKVAARMAELGITTFSQLAALTDDQAETLDAQLGPFAGRLTRDRWVEQARFLAAGDRAGFESVFGRL